MCIRIKQKYIIFGIDDNCLELSSPIHRTEEKFSAEENVEHKPARKGARLDRFAALASTINNWEDDLSHPTITNLKVFCNYMKLFVCLIYKYSERSGPLKISKKYKFYKKIF